MDPATVRLLRAPDLPRLRETAHAAACVLTAAWCACSAVRGEPLQSVEFEPRSVASGPTMFTVVSAAETGIIAENWFADPRMWADRYKEFAVGAMGTGVAIGDYDDDGRPDVFVVSKTERSRLFRNLGGWRFEDVTERAGLVPAVESVEIWKQGAAFADVNNDGWPDLYLCRMGAPNLLYVNRGDGTFSEEAAARGLAVDDASSMAAFADFDRDGWLDVFVQTNLLDAVVHPEGQHDLLFRNNRDGTFTDITTASGIRGATQGNSATWWDYDEDGWPDIYLAHDFATPDVLYRNNHDGTFTNVTDAVLPHIPFSGMGADLGDVDNDGRIDLFVADMAASTPVKDLRTMVASRAGHADDQGNPAAAPQLERNALFLNTGLGLCLEAACLAGVDATDWTWSPRFEDLDNDGRLDLHVTNGMNREQHNIDLLSRMMGAESPAERMRVMRESPVLAERNVAFRNRGDLRFEEVATQWGLDQVGVSLGSAFGDLDGDGDLDLIFTNYQAGPTVLRNDSSAGHRLVVALRGTISNRQGVGAVVHVETAHGGQVRSLVLARGYMSTSEPVLHFGLGEAGQVTRLRVIWPSGHVQAFADLPADRRYTITEPSSPPARTDTVRSARPLFESDSDRTGLALTSREEVVDETLGQPLVPVRRHRGGPALAFGDVNADGRDDLVMGGTTRDPLAIRLAGETPPFAAMDARSLAGAPTVNDGPILILDVNGDDHNDLLVARGGVTMPVGSVDFQPRLFLGDGHGGFATSIADALPPLPISAGALVAADLDRDGDLDVFLGGRVVPGRYPRAPRSALLVNQGGLFVDVTAHLAPGLETVGMVSSALWSDVDGDGWMDLVVALEWGGVRLWRNRDGQGFEDHSEAAGFASAGTGWWSSLAAGDFNGDGRPDIVVGNTGLNTPYEASPEQPALLFLGEFEPGRPPQLVEARHDGPRLVPWRSRRHLGSAIRSILKEFPTNDAFARATVGELVGEERLAAAQRFAATELRSGLLLSEAGDRHRFVPLPRLAQIAPLQGMAVGDFDRDGHLDVYALQNSHAPIPSVGRFAGGVSVVLRGDGAGGFAPMPPADSGLVVRGDARALVMTDYDGDGRADFVVSRSNSSTLAFRGRDAGIETFPLAVVLSGRQGNRRAIGARVALVTRSGAAQGLEIAAGSGVWSHSGARAFFGWTEDDPPEELRVRWPWGGISVHPVPRDVTTLTIAAE